MEAGSELVYKPLPDGIYKQIIQHFGRVDLQNGSWISGGSVRKAWFDLDWMDQDVDYFFNERASFDRFVNDVNHRYHDVTQDVTISPFDVTKKSSTYMTCYSTENANTYTFERFGLIDDKGVEIANLEMRYKMQCIRKYFPSSLQELFGSFDFTACQFATDGKMMVATRAAVEDCEAERLEMVPGTPRKPNVVRIAKYCAYGFAPADSLMESVLRSMANDDPLVMTDEY